MGAEMVAALGARACLGWLLDTQRAMARADRAVARPRLFESRVESARSALFRFDRSVLDRSPLKQHVSGVLHGSVSTAPPSAADPVCRAADSHNSRMFCAVSPGRLRVAMDARGATDWAGESKRLSNVRSASARGSAWSGGQRQQHSPKKIDTRIGPRSRFRAFLCFFGARADPEFGDGTTTSEGDLLPQTCLSP